MQRSSFRSRAHARAFAVKEKSTSSQLAEGSRPQKRCKLESSSHSQSNGAITSCKTPMGRRCRPVNIQILQSTARIEYKYYMIGALVGNTEFRIELKPRCNPNGSCCDRTLARLSKSLCLPNPKRPSSIAMVLLAKSRPRTHQETRHSTDRKVSCNLDDIMESRASFSHID